MDSWVTLLIENQILPVIISLSIVFAFIYIYKRNVIGKKIAMFFVKNSLYFSIAILLSAFLVNESNLQQALLTFASVYFAFWLNEKREEFDRKRIFKIYLGLIWQEIRFNKHQLKNIKANYNFLVNEDIDNRRLLQLIFIRFKNVYSMVGALKSEVYNSFISSSSLFNINDDLFNDLEIAYNDIKYLGALFIPVDKSLENAVNILPSVSDERLVSHLKEINLLKLKEVGHEMAIAYRSASIASRTISKILKIENIKESFTERDDILTDADRTFIERIFREESVNIEDMLSSRRNDQ